MRPRQVELERRAVADFAVDLHMAARLLNKSVDLRETEAGSVADALGCKERIERFRPDLGRHPRPGIRYGEHHILAWHDLSLCGGVSLVEVNVRGLKRELSPIRHRISSIYRKVENRKLELIRIDMCAPYTAPQHGLYGDLLAKGAAKQIRHSGHKPSDVEGLGIERLLPCEGEKPLGQRLCTP